MKRTAGKLRACEAGQISNWLGWFDLSDDDHTWGRLLHEKVIEPQADQLTAAFLDLVIEQKRVKLQGDALARAYLARMVQVLLLELGIAFDEPGYFDSRLRLFRSFDDAGARLRFYSSACYLLQRLLLDAIPASIRQQAGVSDALSRFILKITSLDAALAIETHYLERINHLKHSVDHMCQKVADYHARARTDPLTELANHGEVLTLLATAMQRARERQSLLCLLMIDIDFFKRVNDAHGHMIGDEVLRHVARRIQSVIRQFDRLGRYGGEEFLVILPDTAVDAAFTVAERIRCKVAEGPIHTHDQDIVVTISLGLAQMDAEDDLYAFVSRADTAMYAAKMAGRNQVTLDIQLSMTPAPIVGC